jgi:dienelactone hydrolase
VDPARFAPDASEPLGLWTRAARPSAARPDLRGLAFEFASRGDRVPGRVWLPRRGEGPFPLIVLQTGWHGAQDAPALDAVAASWTRGGAAVASIDLPLHGERASAKVGRLLRAGLGLEPGAGALATAVVDEFSRQAVLDLRRCLDALGRVEGIDCERVAYAGLGLGSLVGAAFCAFDPRPRAAALALGGGGRGASESDPVRHVGRIAPRPVLFVNATGDAAIPQAAAEALHAAASEPKQVLWLDAGHAELPGRALEAIWPFLRRHLGLALA